MSSLKSLYLSSQVTVGLEGLHFRIAPHTNSVKAKTLKNAQELHLIDSVWGAVLYHLDAKYELFKDKKIYLYSKRKHGIMYINPIKLDNWIIVE